MRAGKLDQRIVIQTKTTTYNSYHEPINAWADGETLWAEAITTGGGEFYAAQKLHAETKAVFRVRDDSLTSAVTRLDRVRWNGTTYEILDVNPVNGQNREILLTCKGVT